MNDESNVKAFLKHTSENQNIFEYNSILNDYKFLTGDLYGLYVKDILMEYKDDLKEYLQELYYNKKSNTNTRLIIKDIIKTHKIKKDSN